MSHHIDVNEGWKPRTPAQVLAIFAAPLVLCVVIWLAVNSVWFATSSTGTVRDEKGQPIAVAVVFASWQTRYNMSGGREFLHAEESISDAKGNFTVSWWGPRIALRPLSEMPGSEPMLFLVQRGYMPYGFTAASDPLGVGSRTINATMKPGHVEVVLRRFDIRSDKLVLQDIGRRVRWRADGFNSSERCLWEKYPKFAAVYEQIEKDAGDGESPMCPRYTP